MLTIFKKLLPKKLSSLFKDTNTEESSEQVSSSSKAPSLANSNDHHPDVSDQRPTQPPSSSKRSAPSKGNNQRPSRAKKSDILEIIEREDHGISRKQISNNALKVLYRLKNSGYHAYLVGGGVRDLLLGGDPKDFDIATDAHPEEVRQLFNNSRLIGRRFKLVHVQFGREIIEVATFRANPSDKDHPSVSQSDEGLILRDNLYGTKDQDALRRDFTINALYYNIEDFSIHSYVNGLQDLENRVIRLIGDPETRYREDPVRMLRAARFAAKLNFNIEKNSEQPIRSLSSLLQNIPAARLFEEVLKLFLSQHASKTYLLLNQYHLFEHLFPATHSCIMNEKQEGNSPTENLIIQALKNTEERLNDGKTVTPAFLFAVLLWEPVRQHAAFLESQNEPPIPALQQSAEITISSQARFTAIPRRFSTPTREIWDLQIRLSKRHPKKAEQLLEHPRFRAAYDFILLREQAGENLNGLGEWWTQFQESSIKDRNHMLKQTHGPQKKRHGSGGRYANKKRKPRSRQTRSPSHKTEG